MQSQTEFIMIMHLLLCKVQFTQLQPSIIWTVKIVIQPKKSAHLLETCHMIIQLFV